MVRNNMYCFQIITYRHINRHVWAISLLRDTLSVFSRTPFPLFIEYWHYNIITQKICVLPHKASMSRTISKNCYNIYSRIKIKHCALWRGIRLYISSSKTDAKAVYVIPIPTYKRIDYFKDDIGHSHYNDIIMSAMASQITSLTNIYLSVCSDAEVSDVGTFCLIWKYGKLSIVMVRVSSHISL